jgi:hypothetical protein
VDRTIDAAAAQQWPVGGIDDGIDGQAGEIDGKQRDGPGRWFLARTAPYP